MVGLVDLQRVLADLPDKLEANVLRGAMKAGAEVIADGARDNCRSSEVRATITSSARVKGRVVTALVQTKGDGAYKAPWLEYGTEAHIIRANDGEGRTARRPNRLNRKGALMIGTAFVGDAVWHPGAKPYPFMRPGLDQRQEEAMTVIGEQIAARLGRINEAFVSLAIEE
jgi:HK97 gp10 family phage protein